MFVSKKKYNKLKIEHEKVVKEKETFYKRVVDLENSFKKQTNINIRNEITEVIVNFDKLELAVMLGAINGLIKKPETSSEDIRYCIKLTDKIIGFIHKMKDPKESVDDKG